MPARRVNSRRSYHGNNDCQLRPLHRLLQLAEEIQSALAREDTQIILKASALLVPTLSQWADTRSQFDPRDPEMLRLSRETQSVLTECEAAMQRGMHRIQREMAEIKQHRARLHRMKSTHSLYRSPIQNTYCKL